MAWHGLTEVREDLTLANCWLARWDIAPEKLTLPDGTETPFRILRSIPTEGSNDTDTGAIGAPFDPETYKPVSNRKLLAEVAEGVEGEDVRLASVGSLKGRTRVFLSFEMGLSYRAAGRDFRPFLNVGNSHDKSSPLWLNSSNDCTVCNNTFTLNLSLGGHIMGVRHTKLSAVKVGKFGAAIAVALKGHSDFKAEFERLGMEKCDADTARAFFAGTLGTPDAELSERTRNAIDRLVTLYRGGAGNGGRDWADVFSAATDFYTHEAANGAGDAAANWKNYLSSEFGSGKAKKLGVWEDVTNPAKRAARVAIGRRILGGGVTVSAQG